MTDDKLEIIAHNLIGIMPLFKKKILKNDCKFPQDNFNHSHLQVMVVLQEDGRQSISEVGKKLLISTPNMTKLLNKLIDEGMVERFPDKKDRRIINIDITSKGNDYLNKKFDYIKIVLKDKLSTLPNSQLEKLNKSLQDLNDVLTEISSED